MPLTGLRAPAVVGLAGLGAGWLLWTRDPNQVGAYGFCPFQRVTGQPCPGCGGLRAVHAMAHGDLVEAASSNALVVALVVAVATAWVVWLARRACGGDQPMMLVSNAVALRVAAVVVVFSVVRATPWGSWFAP